MEFPAGMHHYFDKKVCTFHYWLAYVSPKRSWEDYLRLERAGSASAGYVLTLPPDEVIKAAEVAAAKPLPTDARTPLPDPAAEAKPPVSGAPALASTQQASTSKQETE
jgi:hypothetical protein